jgi:hypothetical protein
MSAHVIRAVLQTALLGFFTDFTIRGTRGSLRLKEFIYKISKEGVAYNFVSVAWKWCQKEKTFQVYMSGNNLQQLLQSFLVVFCQLTNIV